MLLADEVELSELSDLIRPSRALITISGRRQGAADAPRMADLDEILTYRSGQGHRLAMGLKSMLETASKNLTRFTEIAVADARPLDYADNR